MEAESKVCLVGFLVLEGVFRHHEVQPALRLDERELDAHLEHLSDCDVVGSVRLVWDSAVQKEGPLRSTNLPIQ